MDDCAPLVVGDANPDSEIIAGGDVFVWGSLRGDVTAGVRPGMHCSPRRRMPLYSRNEASQSQCVVMTWQAQSGWPWCGADGDETAQVFALDMRPSSVTIAAVAAVSEGAAEVRASPPSTLHPPTPLPNNPSPPLTPLTTPPLCLQHPRRHLPRFALDTPVNTPFSGLSIPSNTHLFTFNTPVRKPLRHRTCTATRQGWRRWRRWTARRAKSWSRPPRCGAACNISRAV